MRTFISDLYFSPVLEASIYCVSYSLLFVISLYISSGKAPRDHPDTIKRRILGAIFTAILVFLHVSTFLNNPLAQFFGIAKYDFSKVYLTSTGIVNAIIIPSLLTTVVFLGTIVDLFITGKIRSYFTLQFWKLQFFSWLGVRNLIVAPITEEFVFRAAMMLHLLPVISTCQRACFIGPLFFSIAHLHHFIEHKRQGFSLWEALQICVFQVLYTVLFGAYSTFLLLRTGSIMSAVCAHVVCNHFGFPDIGGAMDRADRISTLKRRSWIGRLFFGQVGVVFFYFLGLIAWALLLYPATEPFLYGLTTSVCDWS